MGAMTLGRVGKYTISIENGFLDCECTPHEEGTEYVPCKHVFEAMKHGLDAAEEKSGRMFIPMYPDRVEGSFLVIPVHLHSAQRKGSMVPFTIGGDGVHAHRVGWVDDHEGRHAMRAVLFEWLRSHYLDAPACNSRGHANYLLSPSERRNLDLPSTTKPVICALASVYMHGECWRCLQGSGADLVPQL